MSEREIDSDGAQTDGMLALAVLKGWVTDAQVNEIEATSATLRAQGLNLSPFEVMVKKGYITSQQGEKLKKTKRAAKFQVAVPGYKILERLGQGAMGVVFKARQRGLGRVVAIKLLAGALSKNKTFVKRFLREAHAAGRVSHPHVIQGIDAGECNGLYYFIMEYVDGVTLRKALQEKGRGAWRIRRLVFGRRAGTASNVPSGHLGRAKARADTTWLPLPPPPKTVPCPSPAC